MILTENEIASAKAADTAVYLPVRDTKNMLEKKSPPTVAFAAASCDFLFR